MAASATAQLGSRIIRASAVLLFANLVFKLAGLAQIMVCGRLIDADTLDVVYVFAFENVIFGLFLIGEETIGPAFLPIFSREMKKDGTGAWKFANSLITLQTILLVSAVAAVMIWPDALIRIFTYWGKVEGGKNYELAKKSVFYMAPAIIGFSLGSLTYMLLNAHKRFFFAAFGDAAWKLALICTVLVGAVFMGADFGALAAGVLIGSAAKFATHLFGLRDKLSLMRPSFCFTSPVMREMALLALPLLIGILFATARNFFNNVTVLSSLDTSGLITANSFGQKLFKFFVFLVPYTLSVAMFPFLCDLAAESDNRRLGDMLTRISRMIIAVFVPLSIFLCAHSRPVTELLLRGGKFGEHMVGLTAAAMACYILVLPAAAVETLLLQAYFAKRKMISGTAMGIIFSGFSMAVSYVGVILLGATGAAAIITVAAGYTASRYMKSAAMVWWLRKSVPVLPVRETALFLGKLLVAGLACSAAGSLAMQGAALLVCKGHTATALQLFLSAAVSGAALLGICRMLDISEPMEMIRWTAGKIRRKLEKEQMK